MTTVAVAMVKDEADIIRSTVAHMQTQVDHVIVADNLSTDGTRDLLVPLGVEVIFDDNPAYEQSKKMTALARRARVQYNADWVVPFDADEWWYSPFGRIADVLEAIEPQWLVASAVLFDHVATAADPHDDDPTARLVYRRPDPGQLPKVACRWREDLVIEMGNHGARYRGGATVLPDQLIIRHFPYRSREQMVRKARNGADAYKAANLPESYGAHWRRYGQILDEHGPAGLEAVFDQFFYSADPIGDGLVYDPVAALTTA